ncbi:MAG TPA: LysM peptidoglycan-binding domain-containing protein [Chthoniobacterales bacterium]|jgi:LysM repeat protein
MEGCLKLKPRWRSVFNLTWLAAMVISFSACNQVVQKHQVKLRNDAAEANRRGDYVAALNLFEASLDESASSADIHFQMALICETKLHDPLGALFHFRRCERIAPQGRHAAEARKSCARLEPMVVSTLSKENMLSKTEAVILKNEAQTLRKQIIQLKAQLAAAPRPVADKNAKNSPPDPELLKKLGGRTYTVEPGDTLEKISRKVYKDKSRIRDIADANINNLPDPKKLQVGQVLIMPQ